MTTQRWRSFSSRVFAAGLCLSLAACTSASIGDALTPKPGDGSQAKPVPSASGSYSAKQLTGEWTLKWGRRTCAVFLLDVRVKKRLHLAKRGCSTSRFAPVTSWTLSGQTISFWRGDGKRLVDLRVVSGKKADNTKANVLLTR